MYERERIKWRGHSEPETAIERSEVDRDDRDLRPRDESAVVLQRTVKMSGGQRERRGGVFPTCSGSLVFQTGEVWKRK
jgi:hypothetical protein